MSIKISQLNKTNRNRGMTLIEILISLGIFAVLILVGTATFLSIYKANQKTDELRILSDNLGFAVEDMVYNIRVGSNYHCGNSGDIGEPQDCKPSSSAGSDFLAFEPLDGDTETNNDQIIYGLADISGRGELQKSTNGGSTFFPVSSPNIDVKDFKIYVRGSSLFDDEIAQVIISLNGTMATDAKNLQTEVNIQTIATQKIAYEEVGELDCNGDIQLVGDDLYIVMPNRTPLTDTITNSGDRGLYELYFVNAAESGTSQLNESGYFLINDQSPTTINCTTGGRDVFIAEDANVVGDDIMYMGTFLIETGLNPVTAYHYCYVWRADDCPEFHNPSTDSGCQTDNANSVHFVSGDSFCVVRVE